MLVADGDSGDREPNQKKMRYDGGDDGEPSEQNYNTSGNMGSSLWSFLIKLVGGNGNAALMVVDQRGNSN
ncbi:hypothetical protein L6452_35704 [Arctium lappa]|uniref:Uncharacterized protein n=1 Tax=Arctium lappa TaxID=4217 RepID=A0ACB8Y766_ARCLA|nr:hypothetical protein L6452_35704 [Arctium lappa]